MLPASATERALASFMTSDGTQIGKRSRLDWWLPLAVCSSHTLASCSSRNRQPSLTNAGHRRRCTYVILPSTSLQTRTLGLSQIAFVAEDLQNRTTELYKETLDNVVDLRCAAEA